MPCDRTAQSFSRGFLRNWPAAFVVFAFVSLFAPAVRADYAVLRSGQRLHITGWQPLGATVRLDLAGGSLTLPAGELLAVEPEEVFPVAAKPYVQLDVPFSEQIRTAASANSLDPFLIASVISAESNFNSRAVSRKSAFGLMQLRPSTATQLGVHNIFDPQQNIDAGATYLKTLLDRYNQNLSLALAAYNAGPNRVDKYRGVPPFLETQNYIRRVNSRLEKHKAARIDASSLFPAQ